MPFPKCDVDPDMMEAMRAAFYRVCDIPQLSDYEGPLTELVVLKIVELAKAGERDPEILCIDVLAEIGTPSESETSRTPPELVTSDAQANEG
jgi:hypothetical protein